MPRKPTGEPNGRPLKYKNPEDMQVEIDNYFKEAGDKPTMSGMAYALGMSRRSLVNYKDRSEFLPAIKKARQRVEMALEANLYNGSVAGTIFNLKNNFDWKDARQFGNDPDNPLPVPVINLTTND